MSERNGPGHVRLTIADGVADVRLSLDMAGRVGLATGFAAEQAEIGTLMGSPNQLEAVTAAFDKRPPMFAD
jgi:hypothetical protein